MKEPAITPSKSIRCRRSAWLLLPALFLAVNCNNSSSKKAAPPPDSTATSTYDANVATSWMELLYDLIKATNVSPPVASRACAYAGVTLYESVVPGMPAYLSLKGQLNDFDGVPQPAGIVDYRLVANAALAAIMRDVNGVFPNISAPNIALVDALEQQLKDLYEPEVAADVFTRSNDLGAAIGAAILAWIANDGYTQFHNCPFVPPVGPGLWVSLSGTSPVEPCWDQMRPFFLIPASECAPGAHPAFDETPASPFWNEANEIYTTAGDAGAGLTADQREIAFFWADGGGSTTGTPPGHWVSIAAQLIELDAANLEFAAEVFAKLGPAVADAFISCWQSKFQYHLERPITYIRRVIDVTWDPLIPTPNFAEYTSGHSVQSGAAARVLTDVFGARAFSDDTHNLHNNTAVLANAPNPRSFADFDAAAREAADSRLFGGIHFRSAIDLGVTQGTAVGDELLNGVQFLK